MGVQIGLPPGTGCGTRDMGEISFFLNALKKIPGRPFLTPPFVIFLIEQAGHDILRYLSCGFGFPGRSHILSSSKSLLHRAEIRCYE